jgi:dienelactone hydrolase
MIASEAISVRREEAMQVTAGPQRDDSTGEPADPARAPDVADDRRSSERWRDLSLAAVVAGSAAFAVVVGNDGSAGWRILRVVAVAGLGVLLWWAQERAHGWIATGGAAFVGVAVGLGLLPHLIDGGRTLLAVASLVLVVSSLWLLGDGWVRVVGRRRWPWKVAATLVAVTALALTTAVVTPAVLATNVAPTTIDAVPADRGLAAADVRFETSDGVELAAWYIASTNGAAVVLRHGAGSTRSDALDEAAVLADHGYGVLLTDARGHGESGGRAMDFGWSGDEDVAAAVRFLADRPDVDATRIGLVGLSMGGEEVVGAAPVVPDVGAIVAEGATARTAADKTWLSDVYGVRGWAQEQIERVQDSLTDLLTDADRPAALRDAIAASDADFLLVTAGRIADEAEAARHMATAAPERVEVWTIEGAPHVGGLATAPELWEQVVVGFLDDHLLAIG